MTDTAMNASATPAPPLQGPDDTLRNRARKLAPAIAERAEANEANRVVDQRSVDEMIEAGLFRAFQPRRFGGLEAAPEDWFGAMVEISRACPSTGWVLGILGIHVWEFAQMSLEVQEEVYGDDPNTLVSSSYAPQGKAEIVPGGYRLTGEWRSSSGICHATWSVVGAKVPRPVPGTDEVVPNSMSFLLPHDDPNVKIVDDWFTMGLAGTGSRRIVLDGVFVPEHRSIDRDVMVMKRGPGLEYNTSPLYKLPYGAMYIGPGSAPAIGGGWGFFDEFVAQASKYKSSTTGLSPIDDRLVQSRVAEAHALLSDMEIVMLHRYRELYETACAGKEITPQQQALAAFDLSRCGRAAVQAVTSLMPSLGAGVVYSSNRLQRWLRDVLTMRQHGTQNSDMMIANVVNSVLGGEVSGDQFALSKEVAQATLKRVESAFTNGDTKEG